MAHFLKKIELLQPFRNIQPFTLKFKDGINIIVGENGSGKSSILYLLTNVSKELEKIRKITTDPVTYKFLDTEKENPRIKGNLDYSKNFEFTVASRFISHGETMIKLLSASKDFKDNLLIIDEPEAGLSIHNQYKILKIYEDLVNKHNCQCVITTHSYIIIKSVNTIFSMDVKKWIIPKTYLKI